MGEGQMIQFSEQLDIGLYQLYYYQYYYYLYYYQYYYGGGGGGGGGERDRDQGKGGTIQDESEQ